MYLGSGYAQETQQTNISDFYQVDHAKSDPDTEILAKTINKPIPEIDNSNGSMVSINAGYIEDINWKTVLDFTDPALRPAPIVLPFFEDFPLENVEIKFRILNTKF